MHNRHIHAHTYTLTSSCTVAHTHAQRHAHMNTHKHTCTEAHIGKHYIDMHRHVYEHICTLTPHTLTRTQNPESHIFKRILDTTQRALNDQTRN